MAPDKEEKTEKTHSDFEGLETLARDLKEISGEEAPDFAQIKEYRKGYLASYIDQIFEETDLNGVKKRVAEVKEQLVSLSPILNDTYLAERAEEARLPIRTVPERDFLKYYLSEKLQEKKSAPEKPSDELLALAGPLEEKLFQMNEYLHANSRYLDSPSVGGDFVMTSHRIPLKAFSVGIRGSGTKPTIHLYQEDALITGFAAGTSFVTMNLYLVPPKKYLWIPKRRKALFYIEKTFSRIEIGNTQQYLEHLLALGQGEKPKYRFAGYRTRSDQNGCREIFFDLDANLTFLKQIMAAIMQVPQEVEKRKQKTEDERRKQQEKYSSGQSLFQKETTQLAEELRELLGEKQDG